MTRGSPGALARMAVADRERDALLQRSETACQVSSRTGRNARRAQGQLLAHDLRAQPDGRRHQTRQTLVAGAQGARERRSAEQRQHLRRDADREEILAVDRQKRQDVVVAGVRVAVLVAAGTRSARRARRGGSRCPAGPSSTRRRARRERAGVGMAALLDLVVNGLEPAPERAVLEGSVATHARDSGSSRARERNRVRCHKLSPIVSVDTADGVSRHGDRTPYKSSFCKGLRDAAADGLRIAISSFRHADSLRSRVRREPASGRCSGPRASRAASHVRSEPRDAGSFDKMLAWVHRLLRRFEKN